MLQPLRRLSAGKALWKAERADIRRQVQVERESNVAVNYQDCSLKVSARAMPVLDADILACCTLAAECGTSFEGISSSCDHLAADAPITLTVMSILHLEEDSA